MIKAAASNGSALKRVLEGKLAIVTGGSRGIGAAVATNLASKGANVIINYTSDSSRSKAESLASDLSETHSITALAIRADMRSHTGASTLLTTAQSQLPSSSSKFRVDILINNAGVAGDQHLPDVTPSEFTRLYETNVLGPILMTQAVIPYLPNDRSGRIVNISSVSSRCGFKGQTVYGGTKAALESMTRTWARELAERATVNAVNPGPVATDMWGGVSEEFMRGMRGFVETTPLAGIRESDDEGLKGSADALGGRPGYDYEIAGVVGMLVSPEAGWTTGSVVCANGGMVMPA